MWLMSEADHTSAKSNTAIIAVDSRLIVEQFVLVTGSELPHAVVRELTLPETTCL